MFLTETELRHLAVMQLAKLLKDASYNDFKERALKEVTKLCYYC